VSKYFKNVSGNDGYWVGKFVANNGYRLIDDEYKWSSSNKVLQDLSADPPKALMSKSDDGNNDITDLNEAIDFLKNNIPPEIKINTEDVPTGGHFCACSIEVDVQTPNDWTEKVLTWPIPISFISMSWQNSGDTGGDNIEMLVDQDKDIGDITQAVVASATVLDVNAAVLSAVEVGYNLKITDGTNTDDLGRGLSIDEDNSKITVETATTNSFASGSSLLMTIVLVPNIKLPSSGTTTIDGRSTKTVPLAANAPFKIRYNNTNASTKEFSFLLEFLY
jgi:hypothetical protein